MTDLIFSFDTEDYVNPKGADGILRASKMIREAGFMPCHNVVAWLAEALVKWGRQDVIDELKKCEITTHSLKHSYHPTINEYTDIEDFDEAMRLFRKEEDEALKITQSIIGNERFTAACPPGDSVSYVAQYGYADMGFEIYDGGLTRDEVRGRPVSFCNIQNLMYKYAIDPFVYFTKEQVDEVIENLAKADVSIIYHHPQKNTVTTFCDLQNFHKGKNNDGEWILSDLVPEENVKRFEENLAYFLEKVKNDRRFNPMTYSQIADKYRSYRVIKPQDIPEIKKWIDEEFFPLTRPDSLCISDILLACRDFLLGKSEHVCEKVYGFLDVPYAIPHPVKVTATEMKESAVQIPDGKFLPTEITVGSKKLGPADWLRAALIILSGKNEATVVPDKWQIDLNEFPQLRDLCFTGSWVHADDFPDKYVSDRSRLQSWTIRLPKGTERKIY
ncbi:MAG: hypothetical protein E7613_03805 [Ruminococcaceae bacterium]|nr:hypothetical protein [Oscillospiraceae bacterium]